MKVFSGIQGEKTILVALGDPEPGPPVVSQVRDGDDSHQLADISIGWDGRPALGSSLSCTPLSTNISLETSELDLGRLVEEEDEGLPGGDDEQQTPTADGEYLPQVQAHLQTVGWLGFTLFIHWKITEFDDFIHFDLLVACIRPQA